MQKRLAKKVLLIGWDAADWIIIDQLLAQGQMPALRGLIDRGVRGKIASLRPMLSPMLWTSVATGKLADKHGVFGFVEPRPDGSGLRPVTSTSRKCKAIWNLLSQKGMRSNVVDWFASYPAEPINGAIVSNQYSAAVHVRPGHRQVAPGTIHPERLADSLMERVVDQEDLGQMLRVFVPRASEIDQKKDDRLQKLAGLIAKMTTVHAAACKLINDEPWDLTAVYYDAIDHFGHMFMPYHPPAVEGVSPRDAELYGQCVTQAYRFHDLMLDATLKQAEEDTTVILISDHGFHSRDARPGAAGYDDPVAWHRPYGVVVAAGPGIQSGGSLYGASLLDVTPTILSLLGLPIGGDMDGRPWLEIFDPPTQADRLLSWEMLDEGDPGLHPEEMREDPIAAAASIQQLVDLGYIESPGEDDRKSVENTICEQKANLAVCLMSHGQPEQAVPLWEGLINDFRSQGNESRVEDINAQLAMCLLMIGQHDRCERVLESLPDSRRERPAAKMMYAELRLRQNRPSEALAYLSQAELLSQSVQAMVTVGRARLRLGQHDEAETMFHRALEHDGESALAHCGLAAVAVETERNEQAVEHALRAVGLTHALPRAHYLLAVALSRLDRVDEAIRAAETALRQAPKFQAAHKLLSELYARSGRDSDRAWKHEIASTGLGLDMSEGF